MKRKDIYKICFKSSWCNSSEDVLASNIEEAIQKFKQVCDDEASITEVKLELSSVII